MARRVTIELDLPNDLGELRLPIGVHQRLQELLDRQDQGIDLTLAEQQEAEGLVDLADLLTLLRLRAGRVSRSTPS